MNIFNISLTKEKLFSSDKCKIFSFPFLSHPRISDIKMKDLVKNFKLENLIYDVEKKKGTIFNFSDVLPIQYEHLKDHLYIKFTFKYFDDEGYPENDT